MLYVHVKTHRTTERGAWTLTLTNNDVLVAEELHVLSSDVIWVVIYMLIFNTHVNSGNNWGDDVTELSIQSLNFS